MSLQLLRKPPQQQCWVIKRNVTNTLYTINNNSVSERPCIIAFKTKGRALQFKKYVNDTADNTVAKQKIVVEHMPKESLVRRCALASLDLYIYEESMTYTPFDDPNDDVRFHLENNFRYSD